MTKAAVIQMTSSSHVKDNLRALVPWFHEAKQQGAELLVLPENFAYMGAVEDIRIAVAESSTGGVIQERLQKLAKQYGIWVIAGTLPIKTVGDRVRAACIVYDENGSQVVRYDKIHLFDVRISDQESHQESALIERGADLIVVDTPIGRVGLTVCYDLRFPELYQQLMFMGAEIFSVPSAFTAATGKAHWEVLLRARAIENLCYVLASNQGGLHENGRETYGHSCIIGPWGELIATQQEGNGIVCAEIDRVRQQQLRTQFPCNDHHLLKV